MDISCANLVTIMNTHHIPQLPLLELDLLKTLVAIAETGNFSAAAEAVFRTPSAVSMQVKKLEEILGKQVFKRDSRSVRLTADGEILLEHARRVLALNRDVVAKFITPDVEGVVRLGAVDHCADQFLPNVLKRFAETHPFITVEATIENSLELANRIRAGEMEIAIITSNNADYRGLQVETLFREKLVWAGVKGGIAWEKDPLPISVWEEGCVWRKAAVEGLQGSGTRYSEVFKSAYISAQKAALRADLAIAPLPLSSCSGDIVPIEGRCNLPPLGDYAVGMIKTPNRVAAVEAVAEHLRATFAERATA